MKSVQITSARRSYPLPSSHMQNIHYLSPSKDSNLFPIELTEDDRNLKGFIIENVLFARVVNMTMISHQDGGVLKKPFNLVPQNVSQYQLGEIKKLFHITILKQIIGKLVIKKIRIMVKQNLLKFLMEKSKQKKQKSINTWGL